MRIHRSLLRNGAISVCPLLGKLILAFYFHRASLRLTRTLSPSDSIDVIKGLEYVAPTSIQAQAIPSIMSGRDIIGVAKTGSGKTMAFILPMFRHIKDQPPLRAMDGPVAMIMTPTRELATQIYKECKPFLKALGLRVSRPFLFPTVLRNLTANSFFSPGLLRLRRNAAQGQYRRYETWIRSHRLYSWTND